MFQRWINLLKTAGIKLKYALLLFKFQFNCIANFKFYVNQKGHWKGQYN